MPSCFRTSLLVAILSASFTIYWRYSDTREFNYGTTADEAANNVNLTNKVIVLTGSNSGIGKPTAKTLLLHGATVVMACRDMTKAKAAQQHIVDQIIGNYPNRRIHRQALLNRLDLIHLDLGSFRSIQNFAKQFLDKHDELHYLVLNAGIQNIKWTASANGIEQTFGINHVGHYYLSKLLLPVLIKTATNGAIGRVISVASYAHHASPKPLVDWLKNDSLIQDPSQYGVMRLYGLSKACNILFAKEWNERHGKDNVYAVSLHPGTIGTELVRDWHPVFAFGYKVILGRTVLKSVEQGAATTVRMISLTDDEFKTFGGSYFADCNEANHDVRSDLFPQGLDKNKMPQKLLWTMTEDVLVKYLTN
eukprot:598436_1